jgi:predicted N-formylglutamate amidohydrolase
MPLLNDAEPRAFTIERPEARSGFVIACDHASNRIPASLAHLGLSTTELQTHIAFDLGARAVALLLGEMLDAVVVLQNYSRLVIDCNRPPEAEDSIASRSEATSIPGNAALSDAERLTRLREIFDPYHDALARKVSGRTILVSMHSFTPVYHGSRRPWHAGVLYQRDGRLARWLHAHLSQDEHLQVGDNEPYAMDDASDYTLVVHGERRGIPHTGIEVRNDLLADVAGQRAWAERLAAHLKAFPPS